MREYLYILIIAAAVTYLLTPLVRRGAIAVNAQHAPRSRDVHTAPTPLLGGIAMYGGLVGALLVAERLPYLQRAFPSSRTVGGLLVAAGLLVVIGAVDDRWEIGALAKLAGQIAAGGIVVWAGPHLPCIPPPRGRGRPGARAGPELHGDDPDHRRHGQRGELHRRPRRPRGRGRGHLRARL